MAHIFKPGDRAYWVEERKWITLQENNDATYPIKCSTGTFTLDGRYVDKSAIALLPLNPYDPTDPLNPPEFRWPFMLNGRPVEIWDSLYLPNFKESARVVSLSIDGDRKFCKVTGFSPMEFSKENFCWPDEVVTKKKVANWVCVTIRFSEEVWLEFVEGRTKEEVANLYGGLKTVIRMIPGTEREVEG